MNFTKQKFAIQFGLSLIELMVAIGIGSLLMLGLTTTFMNSSASQRELERSGRLIENGRYAIDIVTNNIHHAGYYGHFSDALATPGSLPDPCLLTQASLTSAMAMPIQGYNAPSQTARPNITATTCDDDGFFPLTAPFNNTAGSDIFVIRRASTALFTGVVAPADNARVYIQANPQIANLLLASTGSSVPTVAVDGTAPISKYTYDPGSVAAETHEYEVHVYFVAPCSFGTGVNDVCTASDGTVPTLKRLELSTDGTNVEMSIVPLVEGVEFMKVSYGIDTSPAAVSISTGYAGDGVPDTYLTADAITLAQWPLVVSMRIDFLIRAAETSAEHIDTKLYNFSSLGITIPAFNDQFKRHVFSTEVRPVNLAGRRERP
jgi:type IV pilus assembly protein PilW